MEVFSHLTFALGRKSATGITLLGTAFCVDKKRLATAAHVTGASDKELVVVLPKTNELSDYHDTTDQKVSALPLKMVAYDAVRDIAILESDKFDAKFPYQLGSSDDVQVGSSVFSLGFPHANFGRLVLTTQFSFVGARVILGSSGVRTKHLVLNVQTRPGQSGGPVFLQGTEKLVAMIIGSFAPGKSGVEVGGINPQELHQTTHALSAEYILDML